IQLRAKTQPRIVQKIKPRNDDGEILAASGAEMTREFCLCEIRLLGAREIRPKIATIIDTMRARITTTISIT
ncbi:MAG: hypothetical protein WBF47_14340, partial [Xanthobacteraceae bacterium]